MVQWVDIKGYEDYYEVSSDGQVRSKERIINASTGRVCKKKPKIIKPIWLDRKGGYYAVALIVNKKRQNLWLSKIMATSFFGEPEDPKANVEFIDGDNTNYNITNMRWSNRQGRNDEIRALYKDGVSISDISERYNLHYTAVSHITQGITPKLSLPNDIDGELWKKIDGLIGDYYISSYGRVFSFVKHTDSKNARRVWGLLEPQIHNSGYPSLIIKMANGKKRGHRIHRLVAMAFCPGYRKGLVVDHIDGNKLNNKASNLRWVTNRFNATRAQRLAPYIADIRAEYADGTSIHDLANKYGCMLCTMKNIVTNKTYRNYVHS